jgi:hypothetical protein
MSKDKILMKILSREWMEIASEFGRKIPIPKGRLIYA